MLDQYSLDLQAIPALINAIEPQMSPTHSPNPKVAAHVNHHPPPPTPTAQGTHSPTEDPGEPDPPPQPSPQPPPTEAQDRKWRLRQYPLTIPSSSTSPRWQQLIQDPSELDIKSYSCGQETDFNAGTLNIGGSLRVRITDITFAFAATQMDYLCLQDTRQTKREGLIIANLIRELLPPGSLVLQAPIVKAKPSDPPPIGGQMIIISHRWSHYANQWYTDPTQRGLLTGITISNKHSKIRLLSSYWPVPHAANQHSLSLHAHVVQYLQQHNPLRDSPDMDQHHPLTFIQDLIMRETHKHQRQPNHQNHPARRPKLQLAGHGQKWHASCLTQMGQPDGLAEPQPHPR